jgi:uncharacterized Fe-S cluster protein YjdI
LPLIFRIVDEREVATMKVNWDQKVCIHAGECVKNSPKVFKVVDEKFVIDQSGGTEQEIRQTVAKCPSGALTIKDD